jgi:hypothetical protein
MSKRVTYESIENTYRILDELKEREEQHTPPKKIFSTQQFNQLPCNLLSSAEKQSLTKASQKYHLKRLSGQLKKNVEYIVRLKLFKSYCMFKVCDEQYGKNYNILNLELIEVIPYSKVNNMDVLMSLVDNEKRIIIN